MDPQIETALTGMYAEDTLPLLGGRRVRSTVPPVDVAGFTDTGKQRERNEDQFLIAELERLARLRQTSFPRSPTHVTVPQALVLAVADGMGGHGQGDVASAVTLDALLLHALHVAPWLPVGAVAAEQDLEELGRLLLVCQARVSGVAARKGGTHDRMGTTLTAATISWPDMTVAHAGDSRCYVVRAGALLRLTADHTLAEQIRRLGEHPAGHFAHMLVNAVLATDADVQPELRRMHLEHGDTVLLCTDGLTRHVADEEIALMLRRRATAETSCRALVDEALRRGGEDNVTVVVARF